jgi:protein-disulfide isomerase
VKYVFRDFPLGSHQYAQKAAEAAECADDQGKFWEYHDLIFENQIALNSTFQSEGLNGVAENFKSYAVDLGLNTADFNDCLDSGKRAAEVLKDLQDGQAYGVPGTPAFFINGRLVLGAIPFADYQGGSGVTQPGFKSIIDQALAAAGAG